jgi:N utilization substance protein A
MSNVDLVRLIDSISRDKNIDKDLIFDDIESAMASAARKAFDVDDGVEVQIDRVSGTITANIKGEPIEMKTLGRIAAQTAKQVMIQRIREAERSSIFDEYSERVGAIVTGTVARFEGGALIVNVGRAEGILPRSEQIPGESHHPGERIRAMILDVHEAPHQVKIVLTRTHPDYIRRLFEMEVPEVADRIIEIRALAREAGYRTKVAVASIDMKVDAVGACVGVRGSRIRNIVDELGGEKIDIVRWNESSQILIGNALKPAEIQEVALCFELGRATVVVADDQLSLAIGKRGQNVRLAARLTGWDIDILTPTEYNKGLDDMMKAMKEVEGVEDVVLDQLLAMGIISLMDLKEVGAEPLVNELGLDETVAGRIVTQAEEVVERLTAEAERTKAEETLAAETGGAVEHAESPEAAPGVGGGEGSISAPAGDTQVDEGVEAIGAPAEGDHASHVAGEAVRAPESAETGDADTDTEATDESAAAIGNKEASGAGEGAGAPAEPDVVERPAGE